MSFWEATLSSVALLSAFSILICFIIAYAVFWHKWGYVLHSSNSWASRCWSSSFQPWNWFRICVFPYKCFHNLVNASLYSCCNEVCGCCWQKVSGFSFYSFTLDSFHSSVYSMSPSGVQFNTFCLMINLSELAQYDNILYVLDAL